LLSPFLHNARKFNPLHVLVGCQAAVAIFPFDRHVPGFSCPTQIDHFDATFLYLKSGEKFLISDGTTNKTFDDLLSRPDVDDMFYLSYPVGEKAVQPPVNSDPGRVRYAPLFSAMYGNYQRGEVSQHL
jgi:hypothetical protein